MARRQSLDPLKDQTEKRKNKPYFVCDIESMSWIKFIMIGVYDGSNYFYFQDLRLFFDHCFARYNGWDGFAHFGGRFDFLFLLQEILKDGRYTVADMVPRGSGLLYLEVCLGNRKICFRDSSALLPFGLKRLTENFGVDHKKQEFDVSRIQGFSRRLNTYCEYDCRGLFEVIEKFYKWPVIKRAGSAYTLASQAIRVLRTYIKEPIHGLSENLDAEIRPAYLGGRVEIFRPFYKGKAPLYSYDVNSLYPTVMKNHEYPNSFAYGTYEFEKNKPGFYNCDVDVPKNMYCPFLGTVSTGKYTFPTGKFKGLYTTAEINYARSLGVEIKTGEGYVFNNGGFIFKGFVDDLYSIRKSSVKNGVNDTIAKLLLNSCYGRFGLRLNRENIVFDDGTNGLKELRELTVGTKTYRLMTKEVKLEAFNNVAIAAYVTAYARIHMHKIYRECGTELYYTDTDSLFTTKKFETSQELGRLKLEDTVRSACFLLPKTYIAGKKIVMKGFDNKKIKHFTIDDFYECLEGDLKSLKIIEEPKFATLRTALKNKQILTMTKGGTRQLRSVYDKRVIYKVGNEYESRPIHL